MFTNNDGKVTTVDKTWTYVKDDADKLRIVVHHFSLPYTGKNTKFDWVIIIYTTGFYVGALSI